MLGVIIVCDIYNQQDVRYVEKNRCTQNSGKDGRLITDDKSWLEGSLEALKEGWQQKGSEYICLSYQERHH